LVDLGDGLLIAQRFFHADGVVRGPVDALAAGDLFLWQVQCLGQELHLSLALPL
jgi:hypothetical protein